MCSDLSRLEVEGVGLRGKGHVTKVVCAPYMFLL